MALFNLDLFGGSEANLNWSKLPDNLRLSEWFRDVPSCRTFTAHNTTENVTRHQFGGTFWIGIGSATQYITGSAKDPSGLGRWSVCTLLSRSGRRLHVVFGYRPCKNTRSHLRSVYAQHRRFFNSIDRFLCPREAFLQDLAHVINEWVHAGDEVLLLADFNGDIRQQEILTFAASCGLVESILSRHPSLPPPVTFQRGNRHGSSPIDGAWATPGVHINQAMLCAIQHSPGDHRAIVLDIHLLDTIGEPRLTVLRPPARRLCCTIPSSAERYRTSLDSFCNKHKLDSKLNNLFRLAENPALDLSQFQNAMERFDLIKTEGMRFAEKRCRRLRMGMTQFSPALNMWRQHRELWRLVLRRKNGHRVKASTIRRLASRLHIQDPLAVSFAVAHRLFTQAVDKYEELKPQHKLLRQSFLAARLQDPTLSDAQHSAILKLITGERNREAYRRIRALKGSTVGTSISQVEITGANGPQLITGRHAVEQALCQSLQQRFTRAHGSPFLHQPLLKDVGFLGCGAAAQAILEGTYQCPPETDEYTRLFIEALRWPANRPDLISTILNTEAFCRHWRRARESTSSSFSGLHFGHYKAAAYSPTIAHLHARFTQLVFMTGISLSRYQSGLQVILEKKAGAIHVDLLRAILLMEADFNAAMKLLIGHRMVCNAIKNRAVPQECFGSLLEHTAIQVSLDRCLIGDISRQRKSTLAITSVDCLTCYDSVGHAPASIACQRLGAPPSVLCTIFQTIQLMKFFLRTAYGDSEEFYGGGRSTLPFQGVCQGNGAGPAIWLATSIVIMEMVRSNGNSVTFRSPISHQPTDLLGLLYVDDCDLFATDDDGLHPRATITKLQRNINLWQGGLAATGGSLAPKKSSWCLLAMRPQGTKWTFHTPRSLPATLTAMDSNHHPQPIRRLNPHEGIAVVGVIQSLSGTQKPALMTLQAKANNWELALRQGFIPRQLAWMALQRVIWPSLRYPLAVTSFSMTQALSATSRLYRTLLPRLGVNRFYPLALRHAPAKFNGLGLPHPFWEQGIAALKLFLEFGNTARPEQSLLQTSLEYLQLEIGIGSPILQADFNRWGYLATNCWVKNLWNFVHMAGIQLISNLPTNPPLQRQGDGCLMDSAALQSLSPQDLAAFNRCRLAHKVYFLSDIMDGGGHSLRDSIKSPPANPPLSSWLWPRAATVRADWVIWQRLLPQIAAVTVLGAWIQSPQLQAFVPFDPVTHTAFIERPGPFWQTFRPLNPHATRRLQTLFPSEITLELPVNHSITCIHHWSGDNLVLAGHQPFQPSPPVTSTNPILLRTHSPSNSDLLEAAIRNASAIGISDGSYMPRRYPALATAAWILADSGASHPSLFSGVCMVPGPPTSVNAYRAELYGIYALLVALEYFCNERQIFAGGITIGCDNQGALSQAQHFQEHVPCATAHADIIRAITSLRMRSRIHLSFVYVPGHQDALSRLEDLPPMAQMNVWADSLAKKELHRIATLPQRPTTTDSLQGERWYAMIPSGKITADPHTAVIDLLGQREALRYWSHKQQLDAQSFDLVHWATLDRTIRSFPPTFQMWLSKFASGHSAVATTMFRWKRWETATCPLCQSAEETTAHVLLCPHTSCRDTWAQQIPLLQQWLIQSKTAPDIQQCLLATLTHPSHRHFYTNAPPLCHSAARTQDRIGFFGFMVGRLASQWIGIQELHYASIGSTRSATLWMTRLCRQILLITHALWLSRNHQVNLLLRQRDLSATIASIRDQFRQGTTNLLPIDHFYVMPGPQGFSLQQVLDLPLDDQQLWLHAISNARARG